MDFYKCFINNQWIESSSGERIAVENPATGESFAEVPACTRDDVERALQSSFEAQKGWQLLPPIERAGYLYKIAEGIEKRRDQFQKLLVMEQGKTLAETEGEVTDIGSPSSPSARSPSDPRPRAGSSNTGRSLDHPGGRIYYLGLGQHGGSTKRHR